MDYRSSARPIDPQFDLERFNLISLQKNSAQCLCIHYPLTLCIFMARMSEIPFTMKSWRARYEIAGILHMLHAGCVDETDIRQSSHFDFFFQSTTRRAAHSVHVRSANIGSASYFSDTLKVGLAQTDTHTHPTE